MAKAYIRKENKEREVKTKKHLCRSNDNKVIAGVCGGIGDYFNIDPIFIRIIWIIFIFAGGSGIIAYLLAWVIIPKCD